MSADSLSPSAIEYVPAPSMPNHVKGPEFVAIQGLPAGEGIAQSQPAKQLRIAAALVFFAVLLLVGCYGTPFMVTGKYHEMFGPQGPTTEYMQGILYYGVRPPNAIGWKFVYINPRKDQFTYDATNNAALQLQGLVPACFLLLTISGIILMRQSRSGSPFPAAGYGYSGKTLLRANTVLLAICFALSAAALGLGGTVTRSFCNRPYAEDCFPHFGLAFLIVATASNLAAFAITLHALIRVNPAMCD